MTVTETQLVQGAWRATPDAMMAKLSDGQLIPPEHLQLLGYLFYLAARGYLPRLGISQPPGTAKSTMARWACAWVLDHDPRTKIIYASYGQRLAEESSKMVRQVVADNEGKLTVHLRQGSKAGDRWATTQDGGFLSGGVGSGITGFRGNFTVIDDPHKDWAEATSEFFTANVYNWYKSVVLTRMTPRTPIVLIMTRWSTYDLVARIQEDEGECKHCPKGDYKRCRQWCFVRLPAIAEEDETIETVLGEHTVARLRALGVPLPSWDRKQGEALWPEIYDPDTGTIEPYYDFEEMEQKRLDVGPIVWEGLYQQRPPAEGGQIFKAENWRYVEEAPMEGMRMIRWWDTAATEAKTLGKKKSDPDWTAGVLMGMAPNGNIYILDVVRFRHGPDELVKTMRHTVVNDILEWGCRNQGMNQDPAAAGVVAASYLTREVFSGVNVIAELESGDKLSRALPIAAQQARGNVFIRCGVGTMYGPSGKPLLDKAHWINEFVKEATNFTGASDGGHDDMVDSLSMGYERLAGVGKRRARIIV